MKFDTKTIACAVVVLIILLAALLSPGPCERLADAMADRDGINRNFVRAILSSADPRECSIMLDNQRWTR